MVTWVLMLSYVCCALVGDNNFSEYMMPLHQTSDVFVSIDDCAAAGNAWKATIVGADAGQLNFVCVPAGGPGQPIPGNGG